MLLMGNILQIKELSVKYSNFAAITNVNFSVSSDDFTGVIGPNGGGKTTLVKAILGLVPYEGIIEFRDDIEKDKSLIGYLPQQNNFDLSFPITLKEVILSGLQPAKITGTAKKEAQDRLGELMELTGIAGLGKRSIGEVSGGQLQRVLLCRALISGPKLLILDEPATFVDNKFERDLYRILQELNDRMAILMVSHDVGTISSYVKDIVCVNKTVHRHTTNELTAEMLENYGCPIQVVSHGEVPHTVLKRH